MDPAAAARVRADMLNRARKEGGGGCAPAISRRCSRKPFGLASDFFADPSKYNLPPVSDEVGQIRIVGTYKYKTVWKHANKDYPFPNGSEKVWKYKVFVSQVLDAGFDWT